MTYDKPEFEIVDLEENDIVTSSLECPSGDTGGFDGLPPVVC